MLPGKPLCVKPLLPCVVSKLAIVAGNEVSELPPGLHSSEAKTASLLTFSTGRGYDRYPGWIGPWLRLDLGLARYRERCFTS